MERGGAAEEGLGVDVSERRVGEMVGNSEVSTTGDIVEAVGAGVGAPDGAAVGSGVAKSPATLVTHKVSVTSVVLPQ